MRVRTFELRVVAAALTSLWAASAVLVLLGYRPGGPVDLLVGLAAALTVPVALAGLLWPPVARGPHVFAALAWLGLGAALLLVPSIGNLVGQLVARGPQTLLPSPEAGYPWFLALVATALYAGLGVARRLLGETALRRDRLLAGLGISAAATVVVAGAFGTAAIVNEEALRDRPILGSRFGPTAFDVIAPPCEGELAAGPGAVVTISLDATADRRAVGTVTVAGTRAGSDLRWTARVESERTFGLFGAARVGAEGWTLVPGEGWRVATQPLTGLDLDAQVVRVALAAPGRVAAEDRGTARIEGALARHCRIAVDGTTFLRAFPVAGWLAGPGADLSTWRGELDYWLFLDRQVGKVSGSVNGPARPAGLDGVQATITVAMNAVDRDARLAVDPPVVP